MHEQRLQRNGRIRTKTVFNNGLIGDAAGQYDINIRARLSARSALRSIHAG